MRDFTRSEGRRVLILAGGLLALAGLRLFLFPSPALDPEPAPEWVRDPAVAPEGGLPFEREAEYRELQIERELWYEERRNRNWIFHPTEGELLTHKGPALLFVAPIVDDATEEPLAADVYVNGEPVMRTDTVALLMWETEQRPVTLDVMREGYHPWGMRFRFRLTERSQLEGEIRLIPIEASETESESEEVGKE